MPDPGYESGTLAVPGVCVDDAYEFLLSLDSGGVGSGAVMMNMSATVPRIRNEYYALLEEAARKLAAQKNLPPLELDRWKVQERIRIARLLRQRQGLLPSTLLDARDVAVYGRGGRTVDNLVRKTIRTELKRSGTLLTEAQALSRKAARWNVPNAGVTQAARAARYLRYGGRVFFVAGLGAAAYEVLTADERDRLRVAAREGAGLAGGALASAATVGLVIAFGVVTGGWGLVAIGLISGAAGGMAAEAVTERLLFSDSGTAVEATLERGAVVDECRLMSCLPKIDLRAVCE